MLYVVCCKLSVVCCMLYVVFCMLYAVCCMLHDIWLELDSACYIHSMQNLMHDELDSDAVYATYAVYVVCIHVVYVNLHTIVEERLDLQLHRLS